LVIDLMLANLPIVKRMILADVHATGLDYEVKKWEVGVARQVEVNHETVVGRNLAAMMKDHVEGEEKPWMELAKERAQRDA
jgi:hypothetical protein